MKKKSILWIIILLLVILGVFLIIKKKGGKVIKQDIIIYELQDRVKGNMESNIILTEFSDFQCPYCSTISDILKNIEKEYGDRIKIEFKHFPLRNIHLNAQLAAQATEAAGIQGKFWEMHDLLFDRQDDWSDSFNTKLKFKKYAEEIGIDKNRFLKDLLSEEVENKVNKDYDLAESLGIKGTPTLILNGEVLESIFLEKISNEINDLLSNSELSEEFNSESTR